MKIPRDGLNNTDKLYIVVVECLMYLFYHSKRLYLSVYSVTGISNAFVHIEDFLELHSSIYSIVCVCMYVCMYVYI